MVEGRNGAAPRVTMASNPNQDEESKQNRLRKLKQKKWRQKVSDRQN
jgi:hypothetical protein